jgi:hypothetical protein
MRKISTKNQGNKRQLQIGPDHNFVLIGLKRTCLMMSRTFHLTWWFLFCKRVTRNAVTWNTREPVRFDKT